MKITVNISPEFQEPEVVINCSVQNEEVQQIARVLNSVQLTLPGRRQGELKRISLHDILYIESVDSKTYLYTADQVYETDAPLYRLEQQLCGYSFFRVSKAFIINLNRVASVKPEFGSRLILTMDNLEKIIVSRTYAKNIKNALEVQ